MRAALVAVVVAAGVLALSGCAPYFVDADGDATLVTETSEPSAVNQALISGSLAIVDGCFGLKQGEAPGFAAVFPVGTTIEDSGLNIPGLGTVELGDNIEGGGGFRNGEDFAAAFPDACRTDEVAYLNPFD